MQFVPPYPSMGQGNWCQSQGAAQAPTSSQTSHMARAGVEAKTSRLILQGPKGVPMLRHSILRLLISLMYRVCFGSHIFDKSVVQIPMHHIHAYCCIMCERFGLRG